MPLKGQTMKGYVYWAQPTPESGIEYFAVIASSMARANRAFYDFVRKVLGGVHDGCFRACDELTLPFEKGFTEGEVWNLEGLLRNYHYEEN